MGIRALIGGVLIALAGAMVAAEGPATAPATGPSAGPSTVPSGLTLRGRVSVAAGLDLQTIDLSRVVAYLASDPTLDAAAPPTAPAIMAQHNRSFVPRFLVVGRGTTIEFPNWDHFDHNVFSRSKAAPAFDLDRYAYGQSKSRTFDKVGVVQLFCNIHPDMRALIVVTPNPYFARADAQGRFQIDNIPAGQYELVVWQERCQEQRQAVRVEAGAPVELSFTLQQSRQSIMANDPPGHRDGYGVERGLGVKRERLDLPVVKESHPAPTSAPAEGR